MGVIVNFSRISKSDNYAVTNCIGLHLIGLGVREGQRLSDTPVSQVEAIHSLYI